MSKTKITNQDIQKMANLAKLSLNDQELNLYSSQFTNILDYIDQLDEVNVQNVKPTYQTLDQTTNILREDKIQPCLTQKQALSNAQKTYQGYFVAHHVFSNSNKIKKSEQKTPTRPQLDPLGAILTKVNPKGRVGHKDLFCTAGVETTAGSHLLAGFIPPYSSTIVNQLEKLGYPTRYKLNQDAWGHGSSGENSDFFPSKNPYAPEKVSGGSSSGSAVTVATKDVELATGTDTCGSIRMPSCYCNVVGLKPTYGALSRYGVIAFASSLDCPGLLAKSVKKIKDIYQQLALPDSHDATSQSNSRNKLKDNNKIKTIGVPKEFFTKGLDKTVNQAIQQALQLFKEQGYKIKTISLPHAQYALATYYIIAPTEASSNLGRYDGVRYGKHRNSFGAEAKRRIMLGTFVSSAGYADKYYEKAAKVRTLVIQDFQKVFQSVDVILAPVSPTPPFNLGEKVNDPLQLYLMDIFAAPASLAGLPALALPCGFSDKLPLGLQLIGPRWSENRLFTLGEKYQQLTNYHQQ